MSKLINLFLDFLYPQRHKCCICGRESNNTVCELCMGSIHYLDERVCLKCGKNLNDVYLSNICPDCTNRVFNFDRAFSCFEYTEMGKTIIHKFKYEGNAQISMTLAKLMADTIKHEGIKFEVIVPVPIHSSKLQKRGFNQSLLVAEALGKIINIPVLDCLIRVKETREQYSLDKNQRFNNIVDAFCINLRYNIYKYKSVILLDDIYTTGSTVNECSKLLKKAGVEKVYVITAATGTNT